MSGAAEIRFEAATKHDGKDVDLVITSTGNSYTPTDQYEAAEELEKNPDYIHANGARGDFGTINVEGEDANHKFTFSFEETGTGKAVKLPSVMFTFFDLDQGKDQDAGGETLVSCTQDNAFTAVGSQLESKKENGCHHYLSTQNKVPNVKDFKSMTTEQKQNSVVLEFSNKKKFTVDFWIRQGKRNFLFMAHPTFVCPDKPAP